MFVGTLVDAVAHRGGKEFGAAEGESAGQNARPFVEHEEDVQNFGVGGAQSDGAVVFEEDDFRGRSVMRPKLAEHTTDLDSQSQTGVDVGNNRDMTAADHDGIRKNVVEKRFAAVLRAENGHDRFRMTVTDPLSPSLREADRVHECFHRGKTFGIVDTRGFQDIPHAGVVEAHLIHGGQNRFHCDAADTALVQIGQAGAGRFDEESAVGEIRARVALAEDRQPAILPADTAGQLDEFVPFPPDPRVVFHWLLHGTNTGSESGQRNTCILERLDPRAPPINAPVGQLMETLCINARNFSILQAHRQPCCLARRAKARMTAKQASGSK